MMMVYCGWWCIVDDDGYSDVGLLHVDGVELCGFYDADGSIYGDAFSHLLPVMKDNTLVSGSFPKSSSVK